MGGLIKASIQLDEGSVRQRRLNLSALVERGFFPVAALGSGRRKAPHGTVLTLEVAGLERRVSTDISGGRRKPRRFRQRTWIGEFLALHRLGAGDEVLFERLGPLHYRVLPGVRGPERDRALVTRPREPRPSPAVPTGVWWASLGACLACILVLALDLPRGWKLTLAFLPLASWGFVRGWTWREELRGKALEVLATGILLAVVVTVASDLWILPYVRTVPVSASDYLRNGDLVRAVGKAIEKVLGEHAETCPDDAQAARVRTLQGRAADGWYALMNPRVEERPRELEELQEERLIEFVRDPRRPALDAQKWTFFLHRLGGEAALAEPESALLLLKDLQQGFAHALAIVTRDDHRAEVALNWLTAGESLRLQERTLAGQGRALGTIERVRDLVQGRGEARPLGIEYELFTALWEERYPSRRLAELNATGVITASEMRALADEEALAAFLWRRFEEELLSSRPIDARVLEDAYHSIGLADPHVAGTRLARLAESPSGQFLARWILGVFPYLLFRPEVLAAPGAMDDPSVRDAEWQRAQQLLREGWVRTLRSEAASPEVRWLALDALGLDAGDGAEPLEQVDLEHATQWAAAVSLDAQDRVRERLAAVHLAAGRPEEAARIHQERARTLPMGHARRVSVHAALADLSSPGSPERREQRALQLRAALSSGFPAPVAEAHGAWMADLDALGERAAALEHWFAALEICGRYGLNDLLHGLWLRTPRNDPWRLASIGAFLPSLRESLDATLLVHLLGAVASAEKEIGAGERALLRFQEAAEIAERHGDLTQARDLLVQRAGALSSIGRHFDADQALLHASRLGPERPEGPSGGPLSTRIEIQLARGDVEQAFETYLATHDLVGHLRELRTAAEDAGRQDVLELLDEEQRRDEELLGQGPEEAEHLAELEATIDAKRWSDAERLLMDWLASPDPLVLPGETAEGLVARLRASGRTDLAVTLCEVALARVPREDRWWIGSQLEACRREETIARDPAELARILNLQRLLERWEGAPSFDERVPERVAREEAVAAARARGDRNGLAHALESLAAHCDWANDHAAARDALLEALPIRESQSPARAARCREALGDAYRAAGRLAEARSCFERALAGPVERPAEDPGLLALKLGVVLEALGEDERALDLYERYRTDLPAERPFLILEFGVRSANLTERLESVEAAVPLWDELRGRLEPIGMSWLADMFRARPSLRPAPISGDPAASR